MSSNVHLNKPTWARICMTETHLFIAWYAFVDVYITHSTVWWPFYYKFVAMGNMWQTVVDHLVTANICMSLILTHIKRGDGNIKEITRILLLIKIISIVGRRRHGRKFFFCVIHLPISLNCCVVYRYLNVCRNGLRTICRMNWAWIEFN